MENTHPPHPIDRSVATTSWALCSSHLRDGLKAKYRIQLKQFTTIMFSIMQFVFATKLCINVFF